MLQERTILKVVSKVTSNQKKLLEECFFILVVVVVVVIVVFSLHPKKCDDACVEWQSMFLLFFVFFFGFLEVISSNFKQTPIRFRLSEHMT